MARPRKNNSTTTIGGVPWELKSRLRKFARKTKTTKTGDNYEKDSLVLDRIVSYYDRNIGSAYDSREGVSHDTYPKRKDPQAQHQPSCNPSDTTSS